jgi:hypothetical protein
MRLNHIFLISPHTYENLLHFQIEMETVEVFIKTEEDDENGDSLEQHTQYTLVEPQNPER